MPANRRFPPWTERDIAILLADYENGVSSAQTARKLGRSQKAVQHKLDDSGWRRPAPAQRVPPPPAPPVESAPQRDPVDVERERQARVRELREEREALAAVAGERSLRHMIESLFREVVPVYPPPPRYQQPRRVPGRVVEAALIQWSDWHYGEVVKSSRVRGLNAYDQRIANESVVSLVDNTRSILRRLRTGGHEFPRGVLAVNGDLVTGSIHDMERHSNGKSIVESVVECGHLLAESIRNMAADFEQLDVFCTVGNHGRMPDARRMEQKAPLRNWDALVYFFAQVALRDVPNVRMEIPDSYSIGYEIMGWRVLQQHGHEVKSWSGIPWYGIERYVSRLTALEAQRAAPPNVYLFGHFHTATSLPHATGETFINGSLIGGTEFSVNALGKADKPTQWLVGVHEEHGVTHRWPVYPSVNRLTDAG